MSYEVGKWVASSDEERFCSDGEYDTKDEAIHHTR